MLNSEVTIISTIKKIIKAKTIFEKNDPPKLDLNPTPLHQSFPPYGDHH